MHLRIAGLSALVVLVSAQSAFALDAWRDRRGLLFGLGVGGGIGQAHADAGDGESEVGFNIRARVGGGLNERITLDFDLGLHFQSSDVAKDVEANTQLTSGLVGVNLFVVEGLFLRGMAGMGHLATEIEGKGDTKGEDSEAGLGFGFGAGYEFFANADLAIGGSADYRYFTFDDLGFSLVSFGITATWY